MKNYNSEHFAAWCKTGVYCSRMVKDYSLSEFMEFVPGFDTMDMIVRTRKLPTKEDIIGIKD